MPELIFWHIPSKAYEKVAPVPGSGVSKPCVGSINIEKVAPQEAEEGFMELLGNRSSVKVINLSKHVETMTNSLGASHLADL